MNAKLLICCERAGELASDIAADAAIRSADASLRGDKAATEYWQGRSIEMDGRAAAYRKRVENMMAAA